MTRITGPDRAFMCNFIITHSTIAEPAGENGKNIVWGIRGPDRAFMCNFIITHSTIAEPAGENGKNIVWGIRPTLL